MFISRLQTQPVMDFSWRAQRWVLNSSIAVGILALISLAATQFLLFRTVRLHDLTTDGETFLALEQGRQPASEALLSSLTLDSQTLLFDAGSKTFYCSLIEGQLQGFNPIVSMQGAGSTVKLAVLDDPLNESRLSGDQPLTMLAYNDTSYELYHLTLTTLPLVRVALDQPPANTEEPIGEETVNGSFTLYDNRLGISEVGRNFQSDLTIHERGSTSLDYPKNSYKLHLKTDSEIARKLKLPLLGMRQSDDWILYAGYNDPDRIRNTFSSNLWYDMGAADNSLSLTCGIQGRMVELFLGDRYWGVYTLMEPLDEQTAALQSNPDPEQSEYLYRSLQCGSYVPDMFSKVAKGEIAGTYKLCWPEDELNTTKKWGPLNSFLELLSGDDAAFLQNYPGAVDMSNDIDLWLFLQVTAASDNDGKNLFYIAKHNQDKPVMLFAPWDLDQTWGNCWTNILPLRTGVDASRYALNLTYTATGLTRYLSLSHDDGFIRRIQQRYADLRATVLSDAVLTEQLNGYEQAVYGSGAQIRDRKRWPEGAHNATMDVLRQFVRQRMEAMDNYIAALPAIYN